METEGRFPNQVQRETKGKKITKLDLIIKGVPIELKLVREKKDQSDLVEEYLPQIR